MRKKTQDAGQMPVQGLEAGPLNKKVPSLVESYLASRGIKAGNVQVASAALYEDFTGYMVQRGLSAIPHIKAVGRALSKRLPFKKGPKGTIYLVNTALE
jgi:hypothetical protein